MKLKENEILEFESQYSKEKVYGMKDNWQKLQFSIDEQLFTVET